ncbi:MAG: phosphatase PAP2 family protein [Candidatus Omnitrophica bacterium]|nr:phosphatase PAP2 family protein [Candidatus Omnitrophota bacterium]
MLGAADIAIFQFINRTLANPVFDIVMPFFTRAGSGEFIFALAVLLAVFCKREKKLTGIFLLAGLTITYFAVEYLKNAAAIPRPFISLADARLLVPKSMGFSFPSGHATIAFMAATVMSGFFKKNRALWFTIAFLIAFSRIYVGMHYASDVIAGALIGIIAGYCIMKTADRSNAG